ncbi:hypothetical protein EVAR_42615_1 [Eumeta japonica]|uniref:Uncharacterized protein n=1 Tax=Eumeta variegata TaxID=151549 RepID=A0A4C1XQ20_EUMVA|nr:hypothetical protein EVAR_42615_1 [Eumeta japonica]
MYHGVAVFLFHETQVESKFTRFTPRGSTLPRRTLTSSAVTTAAGPGPHHPPRTARGLRPSIGNKSVVGGYSLAMVTPLQKRVKDLFCRYYMLHRVHEPCTAAPPQQNSCYSKVLYALDTGSKVPTDDDRRLRQKCNITNREKSAAVYLPKGRLEFLWPSLKLFNRSTPFSFSIARYRCRMNRRDTPATLALIPCSLPIVTKRRRPLRCKEAMISYRRRGHPVNTMT